MLPRKRQRPNPAATSSSSCPTTALSREVATPCAVSAPGPGLQPPMPPSRLRSHSSSAVLSGMNEEKQVRKAKSWYGSWPRAPSKASASTSVARENILGDTVRSTRASGLSQFEPGPSDKSASLRSTTVPLLSKVPENGVVEANKPAPQTGKPPAPEAAKDENTDGTKKTQDGQDGPAKEPTSQTPATPLRSVPPSSWLAWWSRTPFTETEVSSGAKPTSLRAHDAPPTEPQSHTPAQQTMPRNPGAAGPSPSPAPAPPPWFGFWSSAGDANMKLASGTDPRPDDMPRKEADDVAMAGTPQMRTPAPKDGSTWAFWSRDSPKKDGKPVDPESGEIAVMGEGSEAHPKPMTEGDVSGAASKGAKAASKKKQDHGRRKSTWRKNKRARPPSSDSEPRTPCPPSGGPNKPPGQEAKDAATKSDVSIKSGAECEAKLPSNLLLPSFTSTYRMMENPPILEQIAKLLLRTSQPPANHVFRIKDTPKVRKAIAIGVHGLFPATYLRPMIGQPTGKSLRFASLCADAIRRWADAHGCGDCEIEKVALEGDGRIGDRVDNLWRLMLNWINHIRSADLVVLASHSQGVPVSIMLLEKLIDMGIMADARMGVCAMAGVALGPFPDYRSSILMGSAAELWEFGNPQSSISLRFEAALKHVLDHGARVTFVGSIDDQLVPMESAVYSPASHPYIYRAVFVDGRIHAPDFIAHLVGFALKLRNLGLSDHGLIRELSVALAGSLYSGEGHSRLYYDPAVYDLAVAHVLETSSTPAKTPCHVDARSKDGLASPNPYLLPWIMRGMLEEGLVKTQLSAETEELLRRFDAWRPSSKALKDVKYRLEAVRSGL